MVTDTTTDTRTARVLAEGYGPGAWHGADLKAAIDGVTPAAAFRRPAPGRHNIAEIALHHAYCARNVRAQITGVAAAPFVLDGDDWFNLPDEARAVLGPGARDRRRRAVATRAGGGLAARPRRSQTTSASRWRWESRATPSTTPARFS